MTNNRSEEYQSSQLAENHSSHSDLSLLTQLCQTYLTLQHPLCGPQ